MTRWRLLFLQAFLLAALLGSVSHAPLAAQEPAANPQENAAPTVDSSGWPNYPLPSATQFGKDPQHGRGPGVYLSLLKFAGVWLLFLAWVKTTDWVSQDCLRVNLNYVIWNSVVFFMFVVAFILIWILPWFEVAFPLMLVAYLAPIGTFLIIRNRAVEAHQRVLTPSHIRHMVAGVAGKMGVKVATEKQLSWQKGPPVDFKAGAGPGRTPDANLLTARRSPAYVGVKEVIAEMLDRRGEAVMIELAPTGISLRFQIDGVWHNADPREKEETVAMLGVLKTLAGLDATQRQARQEAHFDCEYKGTKYLCRLTGRAAEAGEQTTLHLHPTKSPIMTFDELGVRAKTQEQLKELLNRPAGFVIFAALPGAGLSAIFDAALKSCDRYMRDFAAIEDAGHREHDIENLQVTTYNAAAKESPIPALDKVIRTYPNAIVMRNVPDGETAKLLCEQVGEDRLVLAGMRSKDAAETMLRVLMLKVPPKDFVNAISGVLCVRLIRKLCDECKESYPVPPESLQQFGIPPGKVTQLFRPPTQADPKKPCPNCQGIGYKGRTGLYELLIVDDAVREVIMKSPKLDLVRAAARRGGMKTYQEEGLVLVVKGTTSLAELQRVLKG